MRRCLIAIFAVLFLPAPSHGLEDRVLSLSTDTYEAEVVVSADLLAFPAVLEALAIGSETELLEGRHWGEGNAQTWSVRWDVLAQAGSLISLRRQIYVYSHGAAHGQTDLELIIWDLDASTRLSASDMIDPRHSENALSTIWFEAAKDLEAQKAERGIADHIAARLARREDWPVGAGLLPSSQDGHFGGFSLWFGSYGLGAYAEVSYTLIIPASAFDAMLRPQYRTLFGGEPRPNRGFEAWMCDSPALVGCPETE